jgi:hypothetical protein
MKTAVEELMQRVEGASISIGWAIEGFGGRPDYLVELSLYRIIQELINNIRKHSGASRAFSFPSYLPVRKCLPKGPDFPEPGPVALQRN